MGNGRTLLFGLAGVAVTRVAPARDGGRVVEAVTADAAAARCPDCGTVSRSVKGNVTTRPQDLPYGEAPLQVVWRKRRWRCRQTSCDRRWFTEQIAELPARARTTGRLRRAAARAVTAGRSVTELADAYGVSWPTVQRALDGMPARCWVSRSRRRCWASTRPGAVRCGGFAATTAAGFGWSRGKPDSSTCAARTARAVKGC